MCACVLCASGKQAMQAYGSHTESNELASAHTCAPSKHTCINSWAPNPTQPPQPPPPHLHHVPVKHVQDLQTAAAQTIINTHAHTAW